MRCKNKVRLEDNRCRNIPRWRQKKLTIITVKSTKEELRHKYINKIELSYLLYYTAIKKRHIIFYIKFGIVILAY